MSPQQNTKIEIVTEAIESLVLAVVEATRSHDAAASAANHQNVLDARQNVRDSLAEFLKPTLRVVEKVEIKEQEKALFGGLGISGMNLG